MGRWRRERGKKLDGRFVRAGLKSFKRATRALSNRKKNRR